MSGENKKRRYHTPPGRMLKGIQVRLDPTPRQMGLLASHAGAARFVYNMAYSHIISQLHGLVRVNGDGKADWSMPALRRWWNEWKHELAPWWAENSKEAYTSGLQALSDAFSNYFKSRNGQRKGERVGWPRRKTKHHSIPKFTYTTGSFGLIDGDMYALRLPRIGRVHCFENLHKLVQPADKILALSVRQEHGKWYATLRVETDQPKPVSTLHGSIGIDLNCGDNILTTSDGLVVANPKYYQKTARKLARAQHCLARKKPGSKRRERQVRKVSRLQEKIASQRSDLRHKITHMLATTYKHISIEDLNVKGMTRRPQPKENPDNPNHYLPNNAKAKSGLNKSILDVGFGEIRRQLEYKCHTSGAILHVIDRWYPSSKTCSGCGMVKTKLSLNQRTFICDSCGLILPRDLNAAININHIGSTPMLNARGETHETGSLTPVSEPVPSKHPTVYREGNAYRATRIRCKTRSHPSKNKTPGVLVSSQQKQTN